MRFYEKWEFEALAEKATRSAPEDVLKRFCVPIVGTLICKFAGAQEQKVEEAIVYNTKVMFEWELRGLRVHGTISQAWEAHRAMRILAGIKIVPFRLKRPLVAAFLHKRLSGDERMLSVIRARAYSDEKIRFWCLAMSKHITEPVRKTILKRRLGRAFEAPVCARISAKRMLACLPNEDGARTLFSFRRDNLRSVADDESMMRGTGAVAHAKPLRQKSLGPMATYAKPLDLPTYLSAYDKRPWRRLRDIVALAHFKAEEMRAQAEGRFIDFERAMAALELCPFAWDSKESLRHTMVFVIWTSGVKEKRKYHLKAVSLKYLCVKAGACKK